MSIKQHSGKKAFETSISLAGTRIPSAATAEAVVQFYQSLDCSKSLAAAILFEAKEYGQLMELTVDPLDFETAEGFRDAYLACKLLSKCQFIDAGYDKEALALLKFRKFEQQCGETNDRLKWRFSSQRIKFEWDLTNEVGDCSALSFAEHDALLSKMRRKISSILGPFNAEEFMDFASWGPGVTTKLKGGDVSAAKKFQCETGITRDLYPLAEKIIPSAYPGWAAILKTNGYPTLEIGNAVVTVPKTSKIDRVIAIEPGLNLWFQKAIGKMIRRRLGRTGIDLNSQIRNQQLAKASSLTGVDATVDFSSASDSIASGLVEELFDSESTWFAVMDICRSRYGVIGKPGVDPSLRWKKFSSMGNGFTFELESLIFYAAASVCCEKCGVPVSRISVYGDDVIIPVEAYTTFCSFSKFLGFSVNLEKSFSSGSFRESCGAHYFRGLDCKPVYLEVALSSVQEVFNFANNLRLRSRTYAYGCDQRFRKLFYWLQKLVPKQIRYKVPVAVNASSGEYETTEGGFISNFDEAVPSRCKHGIEGYSVRRLAWIAVKQEVDYDGLLLDRLSSMPKSREGQVEATVYKTGPHLPRSIRNDWVKEVLDMKLPSPGKARGNEIPFRGRTKCQVVKTLFRRWYDLGPWI